MKSNLLKSEKWRKERKKKAMNSKCNDEGMKLESQIFIEVKEIFLLTNSKGEYEENNLRMHITILLI